jgi:hypothetical protein
MIKNATYVMRKDPALCHHHEIGKSAKIETVSVPELNMEQLVLRVKVFCKSCKEPFVIKTMADGFSTSEIGLVGDELFIPLETPQQYDLGVSDDELLTSEMTDEGPPPKSHLH